MTMDDIIAKKMRIVRQENPHCLSIFWLCQCLLTLHEWNVGFCVKCDGFMHGTILEEGKVGVNFIYEPSQQGTKGNMLYLRDPDEEIVVALGWTKLGLYSPGNFIRTKRIICYQIGRLFRLQSIILRVNWKSGWLLWWSRRWMRIVLRMCIFYMSDTCVRLF